MTLRYRLLLVYLIVVLLSVATVGVALLELEHARRIYGPLEQWYDIAWAAEKLRAAFGAQGPSTTDQELADFTAELVSQNVKLSGASEYEAVDCELDALNEVRRRYQRLKNLSGQAREEAAAAVRGSLDRYARVVESRHQQLKTEARQQNRRKWILVGVVIGLAIMHVAVVGWLLRRWLLWPMERLDRQVAALARDEPPPEPLVTSPREMANLAQALEKARESLDGLRQQLLDGERLRMIGEFAAQLAHNLRNPLASIRAVAQVNARRVSADADNTERMNEIVASVDRLDQWIEGLTEVARGEPTPTRWADLVPTLYRVRDALGQELAAKDLTLTVMAPSEGLICAHDPVTLEHALVAMVVNAIEASPLGEAITVQAQRIDEDRRPARCRVSISDRGPGLSAETPEQIFEFSYSTKQRGMGLGLALARQALQRQGGSAHARNNPDGGATICVELPMEREK